MLVPAQPAPQDLGLTARMKVRRATRTFVRKPRRLKDGGLGPDTPSGGSGGSESQEGENAQERSSSPLRPAVSAPKRASEVAEETAPGRQKLQARQLKQQQEQQPQLQPHSQGPGPQPAPQQQQDGQEPLPQPQPELQEEPQSAQQGPLKPRLRLMPRQKQSREQHRQVRRRSRLRQERFQRQELQEKPPCVQYEQQKQLQQQEQSEVGQVQEQQLPQLQQELQQDLQQGWPQQPQQLQQQEPLQPQPESLHPGGPGGAQPQGHRDDPNSYHYVVSEPLGRNSYKERYLFVFRPNKVSVLDTYQYDDGCESCGNDSFSREPAVVKFSSPSTKVKAFAIVPLHSAPSDAVAEINSLYDVYLDVQQKWDLNDVMLMGDFNADCSYVTSSQWSSIRLRTSSTFQWLIPDSADTTATSTNCAYDRIVVAGALLQSSVVPGSAVPFDFQAAYGLSNEMALAISDHYPVEVTLT